MSETGALIDLDDTKRLISSGSHRWESRPEGPSYYAPHFFEVGERPWLCFESNLVESRESFTEAEDSFAVEFHDASYESFQRIFTQIQDEFSGGSLEKAVGVISHLADLKPALRSHLLARLVLPQAGLYSYGFWTETEGMVGKTPEILVRCREGNLSTMALAGTRSVDLAAELLSDPKELHEHRIVIDGICSQLRGTVGETEVFEIPPLAHLRTEIAIEERLSFSEAVARLHPTAALGVSPRERVDFLRQIQIEPRHRFGAPFGVYFDEENWLVLVAIRCFEFVGDKLVLSSGCGIVPESQVEREWKELALKRNAVEKAFGVVAGESR